VFDRLGLNEICFCEGFVSQESIYKRSLVALIAPYRESIEAVDPETGIISLTGWKFRQQIELKALKQQSARESLIAYLRSLKGNHDLYEAFLP